MDVQVHTHTYTCMLCACLFVCMLTTRFEKSGCFAHEILLHYIALTRTSFRSHVDFFYFVLLYRDFPFTYLLVVSFANITFEKSICKKGTRTVYMVEIGSSDLHYTLFNLYCLLDIYILAIVKLTNLSRI